MATPLEIPRPREAFAGLGITAMRQFCITLQSGEINDPTSFINNVGSFIKYKENLDKRLRKKGEKVLHSFKTHDQAVVIETLKQPILDSIVKLRFQSPEIDSYTKERKLKEMTDLVKTLGLTKDLEIMALLGKVSRGRRGLLAASLTAAGTALAFQNRHEIGSFLGNLISNPADAAPAPKPEPKPITPKAPESTAVAKTTPLPSQQPVESPAPRVPTIATSPEPAGIASPQPPAEGGRVAPPSPSTAEQPSPTPAPIVEPVRTPVAEPTPMATETPKTPEPEPISPFYKELFRMLHPIAKQRRKDKMVIEPGAESRINEKINDGRVNIFFYGIGSEGFLVDSIMAISIAEEGPMYLVNLPRDLASPRGYALTGKPDTRINAVYALGGMDEMRKELEMATGLWGDFGVRANYHVLADLINGVDGTIDVELEQTINDPDGFTKLNAQGISAPDPFYIEAGAHTVDGETAQKIARSRKGSSATDYKRAEMQQKVIMWTLQTWARRVAEDPRKLPLFIERFTHIVGEEIKLGKFKTDFDIETMMAKFKDSVINTYGVLSFGRILADTAKNLWSSGEAGMTEIPPSKGLVIDRSFVEPAGYQDQWITKIKGTDVTTKDPQNAYWGKIRQAVEKLIKPQ